MHQFGNRNAVKLRRDREVFHVPTLSVLRMYRRMD
jgi:hypothetical protein